MTILTSEVITALFLEKIN